MFGPEEARTTMATNFEGTRAVCERIAPLMPKGGRIVNVCSLAGGVSHPAPGCCRTVWRRHLALPVTLTRVPCSTVWGPSWLHTGMLHAVPHEIQHY